MIDEHDDFEANSSVVLLTTLVFNIMLLCVLWTKSRAGDEAIPLYGPVAGSGRVRCGPMRSGADHTHTLVIATVWESETREFWTTLKLVWGVYYQA